jgi:hypothetical protein
VPQIYAHDQVDAVININSGCDQRSLCVGACSSRRKSGDTPLLHEWQDGCLSQILGKTESQEGASGHGSQRANACEFGAAPN